MKNDKKGKTGTRTTLVIRDVPPLYRQAFRALVGLLDLTNSELLVRLMVQSRDPRVRGVVPHERKHSARSAPARSKVAAGGR